MARIVHFEIHAENPDRAIKFHSVVLGWEFNKWDGPIPYRVVKTGPDNEPGINGGLLPRLGMIDGQAVIAYVCTAQVSSRLTSPVKPNRPQESSFSPKCGSPALVGPPTAKIRIPMRSENETLIPTGVALVLQDNASAVKNAAQLIISLSRVDSAAQVNCEQNGLANYFLMLRG